MKRVALCFSGQLRCHAKLVEHWIEKFINPICNHYELTIFFYISKDSYYESDWNAVYNHYKTLKHVTIVYRTETDKDFSTTLPNIFELEPSGLPRGHNQLIQEHYFMDSVIKLKKWYERKNGIKFDYVIRTRLDVLPGTFDVTLFNHVHLNNFCISNHDHHAFVNGRFTICNSDIADKIFTIIKNYDNTIEQLEKKLFAGEMLWQAHLSLFTDIELCMIPYFVYLVRDYDLTLDHNGGIFIDGTRIATFQPDVPIPLNIVP